MLVPTRWNTWRPQQRKSWEENPTLLSNHRNLQLPRKQFQEKPYRDGSKSIPAVNIKRQPRPLFFSSSHKVMQLHVCVLRALVWGDHNTPLVSWEEPGSAPVPQLLTALVLSFGLTFPTCLLTLRRYCRLSALRNVFGDALLSKNLFIYIEVHTVEILCFLTCFCAHLNPRSEGSGEIHSFASLATDVGGGLFSLFELNLV